MKKVVVLTGTTAGGKTEVSIPLALSLCAEIVNADSRQIFRELSIGTAPPRPDQLATMRHHFIAEKSILDRWTSGDFQREGRSRIDEIVNRGRVALVVGGSMLYLRALLDGLYQVESECEADYIVLRKELELRGASELHNELAGIDPASASVTHTNDHHRLLRALAVYRSLGISLAKLQELNKVPIAHEFTLIVLYADRDATYKRVNERARVMVEEGLVDEVRRLYQQGLDDRNCNALSTHGYREVFPYLRGEITREQMISDIQKSVRHYVKRQLTWWRRDTRAVWVQRDLDEAPESVASRIHALI